jgi:hypothetical protein
MMGVWPRKRPWTDHLVLSSFVFLQPAYLWHLAGYWWVGLLVVVSAAMSVWYHRLAERERWSSLLDMIMATVTCAATVAVYGAEVVPSGAGMEWHFPVLFVGLMCGGLYVLSHRAHDQYNKEAYQKVHLAWHIAVVIGQLVLASAVYAVKVEGL